MSHISLKENIASVHTPDDTKRIVPKFPYNEHIIEGIKTILFVLKYCFLKRPVFWHYQEFQLLVIRGFLVQSLMPDRAEFRAMENIKYSHP